VTHALYARGAQDKLVAELENLANLASAQTALEQARSFDRSGQEAQCMDAVGRVKQFVR
jgi:hypothetical protein